MPKASKITKEQKMEIALELIAGKRSMSEICRSYSISASYAYRLRDRAVELLRRGIGQSLERPGSRERELERKVAELEQLADDQALSIRALKKERLELAVRAVRRQHALSVRERPFYQKIM